MKRLLIAIATEYLKTLEELKTKMPTTIPTSRTPKELAAVFQSEERPQDERRHVRVDLSTFAVYHGLNGPKRRVGTITRYVVNEAGRTPTGGRFTAHRLTVKFTGEDSEWVGQLRKGETRKVILRPLIKG